jgi:hypothetical protein
MSGLREQIKDAITDAWDGGYREIPIDEATDAVLRVLAEHGDTQQVREQMHGALFYSAPDGRIRFRWSDDGPAISDDPYLPKMLDEVMAVVAPRLAACDAAVEQAAWADERRRMAEAEQDAANERRAELVAEYRKRDEIQDRIRTRLEADLAAARQQLDQVRDALARDGQTPLTRLVKAQAILDAPARPARHDETG